MFDQKPKIQYNYTFPDKVDANAYHAAVEIDRLGQITTYLCKCSFNTPVLPHQKVEALMARIKEFTEISLTYQHILDSGALFDDDFLNSFEGGSGGGI